MLQVAKVHEGCKTNTSSVISPVEPLLPSVVTFLKSHARNFFSLSRSLSTAPVVFLECHCFYGSDSFGPLFMIWFSCSNLEEPSVLASFLQSGLFSFELASYFFCFFIDLGHSSGQTGSSLVVGRAFTLLGAWSSRFGSVSGSHRRVLTQEGQFLQERKCLIDVLCGAGHGRKPFELQKNVPCSSLPDVSSTSSQSKCPSAGLSPR